MTYVNALKNSVQNNASIMGIYGVNHEGHYDMYVKGMLFLNTLRHVVNNDDLWWTTIKTMSDTTFKNSITDYDQVVDYFEAKTKLRLRPIFYQYIKCSELPIIEYSAKRKKNSVTIRMRWNAQDKDFNMPIHILTNGERLRFELSNKWKKINLPCGFEFDQNTAYYRLRKVSKRQSKTANG
jgi:hypothetical protein